ncbi:MAG: N-6 DNA methylase [Bacteroidaceae bacterium]|nr:N-6 DNA methylase [Bacteroidaceae bacterium]
MIEERNIGIATRIVQLCARINRVVPGLKLQESIIAFTFLRRIDCLIEPYSEKCASFHSENSNRLSDERLDEKLKEISGGYPFYNYSGYTFNKILRTNNSIEVVMNSYLQGYSKNVLEILDGLNFHHNLAVLKRQSEFLVNLLDLFAGLDLSSSSVDNEEFIALLSSLLGIDIREMSPYYTTDSLSHLISECLMYIDTRGDQENIITIYDPVCGTGSLLAMAGEKAKKFAIHQSNISLCGQEVSVFPYAVAKALALLSGNDESQICYGNTLTDDMFPNRHFNYILADMPLGLQWSPFKDRIEQESYDIEGRFNLGLPTTSDSQFLFIEHIISKMDPQGSRAAFITSSSVLWSGTATSGESRIRRWMFEKDLVETIIALPSGTLAATSVPVYLWILSNKKSEAQKGKVRLINASSADRFNRLIGIDEDFVKSVIEEYKSKIISVRSQIVNNEQFGYYEVDLLENGKKKERVTISLDTNIHEFVEKERQPYTKGEITIDYTSVEKGYSVLFEKIFPQEKEDIVSLVDATQDLLPVIDTITALKADIVKIQGRSESKTWTEYPLRAATEVVFGINRPPIENNNGLPILSVPFLRKPSNDVSLYEVTPKTKCSTVNDAIVIVKGENTGEVFKGVDGILTPSVATIKCTDEKVITPQYLYYLLKGYEKELRSMAKGATIKSLDSKSIPNLKCMIPPIEEQLNLVAFLDVIVGKIDDVINMLGGSNNVFVQYRQTLIENVIHGRVIIK